MSFSQGTWVRKILQRLKALFSRIQTFLQRRLRGQRREAVRRRPSLEINWIIPGKLAVGGLPLPGDGEALAQANIKAILSLCAKLEGVLPEDVTQSFQCARFILPDRYYSTEFKVEQLAQAVNLVHQNIQNQLPTYVHCLAGIERSPTVCIAYLCCYHNMELWEAMNWVKQVHPRTMPNESQVRALQQFVQQRSRP